MATRDNLIATYQSNPTLQGRYTQQEYLDMFGFGAQQPTPTPDPDPTPTPPSDGIQNIIGQNLNQGGGGGGVMELQQTFSKDLSGDPRFNYLTPQQQANKYKFDRSVEPREGVMGFIDQVGNKFKESSFFQPKIRGTLGTRLANQPTIPLPGALMAYSTSSLNPESGKFNPAFEGQLNYLEGQDGFIGRDQQSGLLKYGPESVLSGQNVISFAGSNDYLKQLDKYISKMEKRGTEDNVFSITNLSPFQLAKYNQAKAEKQKFIDSAIYKAQQEEIRKQQEARRQEVQNLQNRIDRGDFDSTSGIPDRDRSTVTAASAAKTSKVGGGGYTKSDSNRDAARGRYDDGGRVYLYNRLK